MKAHRGLLAAAGKPRRIVQQHLAVDDFGELPARKRQALQLARENGHDVPERWHRRPNDPHGRWNLACVACGRIAVVATDPPAGVQPVYGHALTERCDA